MNPTECANFHNDIAELALGTLTGRERAAALAHIDRCPTCRQHLQALAHVADMLVLIAPEAEPPPGLTERIFARVHHDHHRRSRSPRIAIAAAALALVVAAGGAIAISLASKRRTPPEVAFGAQNVQVARLDPSVGEHVTGQVFASTGDHPWLFMVVHDTTHDDTYTCELELADGRNLTIGHFALHNGTGVWSHTLDLNTADIQSVHLVDSNGTIAATAVMQ
jgi:hypothetical protein